MRCSYKQEVSEYKGLYIQTSWREAKGNPVGTFMCVAFTNSECKSTDMAVGANKKVITHIAPTKEDALKQIQKKLDKALKDLSVSQMNTGGREK